jgi:hypothetical protein
LKRQPSVHIVASRELVGAQRWATYASAVSRLVLEGSAPTFVR